MAYHVVIDLGSSSFQAALIGGKRILNESSTVARHIDGGLIVGDDAEQMIGRHPESLRVCRPIQHGTITDFEEAVTLMRYIINKLVPPSLVRQINISLATANTLTPVEQRALGEVAREAGARKVDFYNSLTMAAIGAGLPIDEPTGYLLTNLGAGITEVALLSMGGIVYSRKLNIGGHTVDEEIVERIRKEHAFSIGIKTAEKLKYAGYSTLQRISIRGRNVATGLPQEITVSASLLKDIYEKYYNSIIQLFIETIETCPPELVGDIMDRGIVLVGGGAQEEQVLHNLTMRTEVPITIAESPDMCVIRGLMKIQSLRNFPRFMAIRNWKVSLPNWLGLYSVLQKGRPSKPKE